MVIFVILNQLQLLLVKFKIKKESTRISLLLYSGEQ